MLHTHSASPTEVTTGIDELPAGTTPSITPRWEELLISKKRGLYLFYVHGISQWFFSSFPSIHTCMMIGNHARTERAARRAGRTCNLLTMCVFQPGDRRRQQGELSSSLSFV